MDRGEDKQQPNGHSEPIEEYPDVSEREKDAALSGLSELIVYQDLDNRVRWTNRAAGESVQMDSEDLVGRHCYKVWHGRTEHCPDCPVVRARDTGQPQQGEITTPDGRVWLISGFPVADDSGEIVGVVEVTAEITDKKRTEEAYRSVVEHSLQGLGIFQEGRAVLANSALADIVGLTLDEVYACSPRDIIDLVHPDDRERLLQNLQEHLDGKPASPRQSYRVVRRDGTVRSLETLVRVIEYGGKPALQIAYWDVTEARRTAEAYRTLVENSLQGLVILQEGRIAYTNPTISNILGYSTEELYELTPSGVLELVHTDDRERASRNLEGQLTGRSVAGTKQYRIIRKDGSIRWVETLADVMTYRGKTAVQVVYRDITDARAAEDALKESEERYRKFFQAATDSVFVETLEGRILDCNDAACKLYGYTREEMLSLNVADIVPEEVRRKLPEIIEEHKRAGGFYIEAMGMRRSGEVFPTEVSTRPVVLEGEERAIVFVRDITPRKKAEEEQVRLQSQLQQAQKLEAIGTLAGGVAHEINNPVHITMNFAKLIRDRLEEGSELREYAQEIIDEGGRISSIVHKLLSFARQEKEQYSAASISGIVDSAVSLMKMVMEGDGITVEVDVPDDLPDIMCRSQQVQQVLMNLMTNARDALNQRFPGPDPDKLIRVGARVMEKEGGQWVRTTVEDHGLGIQPGTLDRIFDPFFTTKPREQGTGLGLSVSYGIVKEHRGDLWVESEPGSHTRFHMDLRV